MTAGSGFTKEARELSERQDWSTLARLAASQRDAARPLSQPQDGCKRILVTGGAGFIGSHLVRRLLRDGHSVVVVDDFNDYYDPLQKYENLSAALDNAQLTVYEADLRDREALRDVFTRQPLDGVIHLAARAGVRPSLLDPQLYITTNVLGTQNLLDLARDHALQAFVYASSSSVYGGSTDFPFRESQPVDHPISPYAATKKTNELQAACYSRLYGLPVTGLRFFTVYGPAGRPDMSIRIFIERWLDNAPFTLYGDGSYERDFTYIDDAVDGILGAFQASFGQKGWCEIFNIGEHDTTSMREIVLLIAAALGRLDVPGEIKSLDAAEQTRLLDRLVARGELRLEPAHAADLPKTFAAIDKARERIGYRPQTRIAEGLARTVAWHLARQARPAAAELSVLRTALGVHCDYRRREGFGSLGERRNPRYARDDAAQIIGQLEDLERGTHLASSLEIRGLARFAQDGLTADLARCAARLAN